MEDHKARPPWLPEPFTVAVLDSDPYLGDILAKLLRERGFAPAVFYDGASLLAAHASASFDAYVLDAMADWPRPQDLEAIVASIHARESGSVPVFILGNQVAPERSEGLSDVLMRHKVRYVLRPVRADYIAAQVGEEVARRFEGRS